MPVITHMLGSLAHVLSKAEANATERKIDLQVFVNARLAPDMLPLKRQVQIASDNAKGMTSRLAGRDAPKYEDNEESFAELQARIAKTRDYVASLTAAEFDGSETRPIQIKSGGRELNFSVLSG